jgi:hypothetical protein
VFRSQVPDEIVAIDVAVTAAVNIVLFDTREVLRVLRNLRVKVAIVSAEPRDIGMINGTARVRVEVAAPIMRPLPAVPGVESIVVLS